MMRGTLFCPPRRPRDFIHPANVPAGTAPERRYAARAIYDPPRDRVLVVGGRVSAANPYRSDVWELVLANTLAWNQLTPVGTSPPIQ